MDIWTLDSHSHVNDLGREEGRWQLIKNQLKMPLVFVLTCSGLPSWLRVWKDSKRGRTKNHFLIFNFSS